MTIMMMMMMKMMMMMTMTMTMTMMMMMIIIIIINDTINKYIYIPYISLGLQKWAGIAEASAGARPGAGVVDSPNVGDLRMMVNHGKNMGKCWELMMNDAYPLVMTNSLLLKPWPI